MSNPIKVLLVEDDSMVVKMYQTKFKLDGFDFSSAFNGEEGLEAVKNNRPDIVFLDIMMPKMNGLEMLKIMKATPELKEIPVVMLTNLGDRPEDIDHCRDLGAEDYLVKANSTLKQIVEKIEQVLKVKTGA